MKDAIMDVERKNEKLQQSANDISSSQVSKLDSKQKIQPEHFSWIVKYLRESKGGWKKCKSPQEMSVLKKENRLIIQDTDHSNMKENIDLKNDTSKTKVSIQEGKRMKFFIESMQGIKKFAVEFAHSSYATKCAEIIHSAGVEVKGFESICGTISPQTFCINDLIEDIPDISKSEVQTYVMRLLFQDSFHEFVVDLGEFLGIVSNRMPEISDKSLRSNTQGSEKNNGDGNHCNWQQEQQPTMRKKRKMM